MNILHIASINVHYPNGLTNAVLGHFKSQLNLKQKEDEVYLLNISSKPIQMENVFNLPDLKNTELYNLLKGTDIVIFHGLFYTVYMKIFKIIKKYNIKYIVVPHSALTKQGLSKSKFKKYLYLIIFLKKFILNSTAIHFLSQQEKNDSMFSNHNNFVIPNGIDIPIKSKEYDFSRENKPVIIGYIGRLDFYQKGLDILIDLIENFVNSSNYKDNFVFYIYGPDYKGRKNDLIELINDKNIDKYVKVCDPVFDEKKYDALRNIDVFIHTSRFEGLPMSILEALSVGLPCIVSKGTNFEETIRDYDAGWCLSDTNFQDILEQIIIDKSILTKKSKNAKHLIGNYNWENVTMRLLNMYRKLVR